MPTLNVTVEVALPAPEPQWYLWRPVGSVCIQMETPISYINGRPQS